MTDTDWRSRAATQFTCEKQPASGARGMVVTNHPLASAAGAEMLAAGGNAIDAAIAALFTLTVVEPMMVGILGGGMAHLRLADGRHLVIDGLGTAPLATGPETYTPDPKAPPGTMNAVGRKNALGPTAVAVPGTLKAWCDTLARFGTFPLSDVLEPAIRHASRGFRATPYLSECAAESAADLARDAEIARLFLPGGAPIAPGTRLVQGAYAETLRAIAAEGPGLLYGGALGRALADHMARAGAYITQADLAGVRIIDRDVIRGAYRGYEIVGPPPPASSGVHVTQMLNILEGFDLRGMGFGSPDALHLLAEALKIAFADRAVATADPAFVDVPVARLIDRAYADARRAEIDMRRARNWGAGVAAGESANTTHITVADARRQHRRQHADNQQPVRRALRRARHRHDPEQLHVSVRPPPRPRAIRRTRQARHHLDGAAHRVARGKARIRARPAGRPAHLRLGDAGGHQPDRPRHVAAGSGRGAPALDPGLCHRDGDRLPRTRPRGVARARPRGAGGAARWRRHVRGRLRR